MNEPLTDWEKHPSLDHVRRYASSGRIAVSVSTSLVRMSTDLAVHREDGTVAARRSIAWTSGESVSEEVKRLYGEAS